MSDKPGCGGWEYATEHGIATVPFPLVPHASTSAAEALRATLRDYHAVDFVVLAGFCKVHTARPPVLRPKPLKQGLRNNLKILHRAV